MMSLERLRASGEVSGPDGTLDDLPDPLNAPAGSVVPSMTVKELRTRAG
jgi:hypothetical protein